MSLCDFLFSQQDLHWNGVPMQVLLSQSLHLTCGKTGWFMVKISLLVELRDGTVRNKHMK